MNFQAKICNNLKSLALWGLDMVLGRCDDILNCGIEGNHSAFKKGLIYDFIMSSCVLFLVGVCSFLNSNSVKDLNSFCFSFLSVFCVCCFCLLLCVLYTVC